MKKLTTFEAFGRFSKQGYHSNHFVWFLAGVDFFEVENWLFAVKKQGNVLLIVLDPLPPESENNGFKGMEDSALVLCKALGAKYSVFVCVYEELSKHLIQTGYARLDIGKDIWLKVSGWSPRGNSAKGVRAGRNQATKKSVRVVKWEGASLNREQISYLETLASRFLKKHWFILNSFLNAVKPSAYAAERNYYIAINKNEEIEGYLVASPIPAEKSIFFEDIILAENAINGVSELLCCSAISDLETVGMNQVSLGIVLGSPQIKKDKVSFPAPVRFFLNAIVPMLDKTLGWSGLQTFRMRFTPYESRSIFLAVKSVNGVRLNTWEWLNIAFRLFRAFNPKTKTYSLKDIKTAPLFNSFNLTGVLQFASWLFSFIDF